jgi:hypothetical protein
VKVSAPGGPQVKPGESRAITVDVKTGTWEGEFKKVLLIETNDRKTPLLNLTVKARIYSILQIEPKFIDFGDIRPGSVKQRDILIRNRGQSPVTLTHIAIDPPAMASIAPLSVSALAPGSSAKLVLKLSPGAYTGPIYGSVIIDTNWKDLPRKTVRFRSHVVAGIH